MSKSLELSRAAYAPSKKIFGFLIKAIGSPEVHYKLASILVKYSIKPLYGVIISINEEQEILLYLDFSEVKASLNEIVKNLRNVKEVREVHLIKPILKGLLIDTIHFPITVFKERAWIARESVLRGLFRGLRLKWGDVGKMFLYHQGAEVGKHLYNDYRKYVTSAHEMLTMFAAFLKAVGWGIIEEIKQYEDLYIIRGHNNLECYLNKPSNEPSGHFSRGVLAGLLSELTGREMVVDEVKCIAKGDPYCEFVAKPKE